MNDKGDICMLDKLYGSNIDYDNDQLNVVASVKCDMFCNFNSIDWSS